MHSLFPVIDSFLNLFTKSYNAELPKMDAPLRSLHSWSPFRLDALGLLTMLGAEEMSREIGSLSTNTLVSWLSLLGGNVIPSNAFVDALHGFTLYNISDAIQSTSLAGWFSRWLLAQRTSQNTSLFIWSVRFQPRSYGLRAPAIGIAVNACITALPLLSGDFYGLAAALSMDLSVFVRAYLVAQNRSAIDRAAADTSVHSNELVRTIILLANGKATTVLAPRNVVVNCFLSPPKPVHPIHYGIARAIGWLAFAGFVVTIGQASLVVQMTIVVVTVLATVLTALRIGTEDNGVGKMLQAARLEHPNKNGRRGEAYAMLHLSKEEEETMVDWSLFPQRRNKKWWDQYRAYQKFGSQTIDIDKNSSTENESTYMTSSSESTLIEEKFPSKNAKV